MMNIYDVYISCDNTVKGNDIHVVMPARSHEESMDQALDLRGLDYRGVESIIVVPRKEEYDN